MLICIHSCVWNTIWLISLLEHEHVNISMKEIQVATKNQRKFIWNRFIGVYAFGFLFMLPQLFVNYKVRDYPFIHTFSVIENENVMKFSQQFYTRFYFLFLQTLLFDLESWKIMLLRGLPSGGILKEFYIFDMHLL